MLPTFVAGTSKFCTFLGAWLLSWAIVFSFRSLSCFSGRVKTIWAPGISLLLYPKWQGQKELRIPIFGSLCPPDRLLHIVASLCTPAVISCERIEMLRAVYQSIATSHFASSGIALKFFFWTDRERAGCYAVLWLHCHSSVATKYNEAASAVWRPVQTLGINMAGFSLRGISDVLEIHTPVLEQLTMK